jgi:hypothetical protein
MEGVIFLALVENTKTANSPQNELNLSETGRHAAIRHGLFSSPLLINKANRRIGHSLVIASSPPR